MLSGDALMADKCKYCGKPAAGGSLYHRGMVCIECLFKDLDEGKKNSLTREELKVIAAGVKQEAAKSKSETKPKAAMASAGSAAKTPYVDSTCEACGKTFSRYKCHPYLTKCKECR